MFLFSVKILKFRDKLRDKLICSLSSIGANIVKGENSNSKKEFVNFFQISLKPASDTLYWLSFLKEINKNYSKEIVDSINKYFEIKKIISTIILNVKNSKLTHS